MVTRDEWLLNLEKVLSLNPGPDTLASMIQNVLGITAQPTGGSVPPAATTRPYADRDPANIAEAAKCPVHKTRMSYKSDGDGSWTCTSTNPDGTTCKFKAFSRVEDITLLKSHKYTGPVKLYAANSPTATGEAGVNIFLTLTEIGIVVDITPYIDLGVREAVDVATDQSCKLALAFDRIDFATGKQ